MSATTAGRPGPAFRSATCRGTASTAAAVLERFVGQRLVTKDRAAAEITHEALLGAWPRLRGWIEADREDIRIRQFIEVAAQTWAQAGREAAALLRGGQLALAVDWMAGEANRAALSQLGRDFVDAGIADERAQQAAARRYTRRLRQLVAALTVLVLLTVGLAGYAFHQRQLATTAKDAGRVADRGRGGRPGPSRGSRRWPRSCRWPPTTSRPPAAALASLLESSGAPAAARMLDSDARRAGRRAVPGPPAARRGGRRRHAAAVGTVPGPATRR